MHVVKTLKRYTITEFAVAFYTYILHMKIDVSMENIVFLYQQKGKIYCIKLDFIQNTSFKDTISSAKIEEIKDISCYKDKDYFICLFIDDDDFNEKRLINIQTLIKRNGEIYEFDLGNGFSYNQKQNFEKYFMRVLHKICNDYSCKLESISILEKAEKEEIKSAYKNSYKYDESKTILDYFKEHLDEMPNKICVTFEGIDYSYMEVDLESNCIANEIIDLGVCPKQGIVIFMERSNKIISAILGVMKCNCYYIPIDVSTPIERLKKICEDSEPFTILTDNYSYSKICDKIDKKINIINLDKIKKNNQEKLIDIKQIDSKDGNDCCYIIYTSGTTGNPKGVAIRNKNIGNFVVNNIIDNNLEDKESSAIISVNKIGFDAFVADSLLPLAIGLRIVMASNDDLINAEHLIKTIEETKANVIQTTPTRLKLSILDVEPENLNNFKIIACGGEVLLQSMIDKIKNYSDAIIINLYGPTETTVWSTTACITKGDRGIGKPSVNQNCFVLNRYMKLLPKYEVGGLYISGDGLGEYRFDELNQKIKYFMCDETECLVYNTGDAGYIDCDNYIIFKARMDTQVKINGVRIELTEIENVALELKEIEL